MKISDTLVEKYKKRNKTGTGCNTSRGRWNYNLLMETVDQTEIDFNNNTFVNKNTQLQQGLF
jgi:hypothetical protein